MNNFKVILLAAVVLLPLSGVAMAADIDPVVPAEDVSSLGLYLRADAGWSMLNFVGNDNAYTAGLGVGYQYNDYFRTDITGEWSGKYNVAPGAAISTRAIMGNAYFDLANDTVFTPYVGVGAGYGWVNGSGTAVDAKGMVLGAAAGVAVDLTNNIAIDVGYKMRDFIVAGNNPVEHAVTAGLRFKF